LALLVLSILLVLILMGVAGHMVHKGPAAATRRGVPNCHRESTKLYTGSQQPSKGRAELVDPFLSGGARGSGGSSRSRRSEEERRGSPPALLGRTRHGLTPPVQLAEEKEGKYYYLPKYIDGIKVLFLERDNTWRVDNSNLRASSPGLGYRKKKDLDAHAGSDVRADWGDLVQGTDAGDGWVKCHVQEALSTRGGRPSSGSASGEDEPSDEFCSDLVVPPNCECLLVVPLRPIGRDGSFSVSDSDGLAVLRVAPEGDGGRGEAYDRMLPPCSAMSLTPGHPRRTGDKLSFMPYGGSLTPTGAKTPPRPVPLTSGLSRLQLMTADGNVLAKCGAVRRRGATEFHLARADGAHFGTLATDEHKDRYTLATMTNTSLNFWGSFEHHAVNITDEAGTLLATTEPCNTEFDASSEYYRLRVAPGADVGLVVCSLLCIDHLGGETKRGSA
jgi:hypothetical protein